MGEASARTSFAPPPGEAGSFRYRDKGYHQVFALSGHHVAKGGVLIETLSPLERSRTLTFEMRTAEGRSLEGVCVVVRTREAERSGPDRPPGMIVRFIHFDDQEAARSLLGSLIARQDVPQRGRDVLGRMLEHCNQRPSATIEDEASMGDVPPAAPSSPEAIKAVQPNAQAQRRPSRRTIAVASGAVALVVLTVAAVMASGTPGPAEPEATQDGPPRDARPVELPKPDPAPPPKSTTPPRTTSSAASLPSPSELENGPGTRTPPGSIGPPGQVAPGATNEDPYDGPARPAPPPPKRSGEEPYD